MKHNEELTIVDSQGSERQYDERTGALIVPTTFARVGVQTYMASELGLDKPGTVTIYRPAEEVFHPESLKTYQYAPVLDTHVATVTQDNTSEITKGFIVTDAEHTDRLVQGKILIQDKELINKIDRGINKVSMGYTSRLDWTPGKFHGVTYDGIMRDIRINHCAIVPNPRGGVECAIADSTDKLEVHMNQKETEVELETKVEVVEDSLLELVAGAVIDKVAGEVVEAVAEVVTEVASDVIEAVADKVEEVVEQITDAEIPEIKTFTFADSTIEVSDAQLVIMDAMSAHINTLEATAAELTVKLNDSTPNDKVEALVQDSLNTREKALKLNPKMVIDGLTSIEIKRQLVHARFGNIANESQEVVDACVSTLFDSIEIPNPSLIMDSVFANVQAPKAVVDLNALDSTLRSRK